MFDGPGNGKDTSLDTSLFQIGKTWKLMEDSWGGWWSGLSSRRPSLWQWLLLQLFGAGLRPELRNGDFWGVCGKIAETCRVWSSDLVLSDFCQYDTLCDLSCLGQWFSTSFASGQSVYSIVPNIIWFSWVVLLMVFEDVKQPDLVGWHPPRPYQKNPNFIPTCFEWGISQMCSLIT